MNLNSLILVLVVFGGLSIAARADESTISMGGAPQMLHGHRTVRMEAEVVHITVRKDSSRVVCDFDFANSGPDCRVRMGFPDQGDADIYGDTTVEEATGSRYPSTNILGLKSFVNGVQSPTRLVRAASLGEFWHVKTVHFPAHRHVHVRDVYISRESGGDAEPGGSYISAAYIVHTGASWKGVIGHCTILVEMRLRSTPPTVYARRLNGDPGDINWLLVPRSRIYYTGLAKPTVTGRTLRFERFNMRPTLKDDLTIYSRQDPHVFDDEHY